MLLFDSFVTFSYVPLPKHHSCWIVFTHSNQQFKDLFYSVIIVNCCSQFDNHQALLLHIIHKQFQVEATFLECQDSNSFHLCDWQTQNLLTKAYPILLSISLQLRQIDFHLRIEQLLDRLVTHLENVINLANLRTLYWYSILQEVLYAVWQIFVKMLHF